MGRILLSVLLFAVAACSDAAEVTTTAVPAATTIAPSPTTTITTTAATLSTTTTQPSLTTTSIGRVPTTTTGPPACADLGTGTADLAVFGTPSGTRRWSIPAAAVTDHAVVEGVVYATLEEGTLVAVDAADCTELWRAAVRAGVIGVAGGTLYAAGADLVSARDAVSGAPVWSTAVGGIAPLAVLTAGDSVVIADGAGQRLLGFDAASGDPKFDTGVPGLSSVAVGEGLVFMAGGAQVVIAQELETGVPAWSVTLSATATALTFDRGGLFVPLEGGSLAALDAGTGELRWEVAIGAEPVVPPMIDHNEVHQLDARGALHHLRRGTGESVFVGTFPPGTVAEPDAGLVVATRNGTVTASNLLERVQWSIETGADGAGRVTEISAAGGLVAARTYDAP